MCRLQPKLNIDTRSKDLNWNRKRPGYYLNTLTFQQGQGPRITAECWNKLEEVYSRFTNCSQGRHAQ